MSDNTKIAIFTIVILLLLYSKKLTEVVTAKVGGVPVSSNLGSNTFDYAVCGIAPDVIRNGLAIKVCTDPITGNLYPIEEYPNGGASAQIVYLREQRLIDESLRLNTPTSAGVTTGPVEPGFFAKVIDWYGAIG